MALKITPLCLLSTFVFCVFSPLPDLKAQISSDGTLSTTVSTDDGVNFLIENGDRSGNNLFHSFREFSIPNLGSAYFDNATDITNIFSRVTGGNISDIQGLIRANGTANLFLINPAGIVFGENAALDIGGSFFATTAESVVFGDGIEFSATEPQEAPLLTINITPGLQMGANPGDITINGTGHEITGGFPAPTTGTSGSSGLKVTSGNTLALIGGNIQGTGAVLVVESGKVEVGAIGSNSSGTINLSQEGSVWTFDYSNINNFALVRFIDKSLIDISGLNPLGMNITAGDIQLEGGTLLLNNHVGNQQAGDININASGNFAMSRLSSSDSSETRILSYAFADGDGSNINLTSHNVTLNDGSYIFTNTLGAGGSGTVTVNAVEDISLTGTSDLGADGFFQSTIAADTFGAGQGGSVILNARSVTGRASSIVSLITSTGDGGDVIINATESVSLIGRTGNFEGQSDIRSTSFGHGKAGTVEINTARILLEDGGLIEASNQARGASGNVILNVSESIDIRGSIFSPDLQTTFFSQVRASTTSPVPFIQDLLGIGAIPSGDSGSVIINSPVINVADGGLITALNEGVGDGGSIIINGDNLNLSNQASLLATTESGTGGSINLNLNDIVSLRSQSEINAESSVTGDGGNIDIQTSLIVGLENSEINANAVTGNGGNITITVQGLFFSPNSSITASSQFGVDGVVEINTPDEENKLAIAELPGNFTDASQQIVGNCSWTRDNTFYVVGRRGIAKTPQEHIEIYQMWSDIRDLSEFESATVIRESSPRQENTIVEANAMIINEDGKVELVAVVPNNNQNLGQVASSCSGEVDS